MYQQEQLVRLTDKWIVVHEVIESSSAKRKSAENLTGLNHFPSVRDHSHLDKIDYTITEHLRVNAKITVVN